MTRKIAIWTSAALLVAGFGFINSESASAAWGRGYGYQTNGYGHQSYGNSGYGYQNYGFQQNFGYSQPGFSNRGGYQGGHSDYRDTTRFDYHPPTVSRHGNHLDRTPGQFDQHRSGHYDRH